MLTMRMMQRQWDQPHDTWLPNDNNVKRTEIHLNTNDPLFNELAAISQ